VISTEHRWIFLHVPRTAGSSLSQVLLPHSDERAVTRAGVRAGYIDSFELEGPVTSWKHMTLREYSAVLGPAIDGYRILTSLRHPVERMLSLYLYPGFWVRPRVPGARTMGTRFPRLDTPWLLRRDEPSWSPSDFEAMVRAWPTQTDYLRHVRGHVVAPDWTLDTHDGGRPSMAQLRALLGLPLADLPQSNRALEPALATELLHDPFVNRVVRWLHAADFEHFGFE
jgi:hypothetical protein